MNKPTPREGFVDAEVIDKPDQAAAVGDPALPESLDEPASEWPIIIKLLHKPLQIPGKDPMHELVFREPTAGDIISAGGNPCRLEIIEMSGGLATYQPVIDDKKMLSLMAMLCNVPNPFLQRLDPRDYNSCAYKLRRFFHPEQGLW